jgi:hypothetical protein
MRNAITPIETPRPTPAATLRPENADSGAEVDDVSASDDDGV